MPNFCRTVSIWRSHRYRHSVGLKMLNLRKIWCRRLYKRARISQLRIRSKRTVKACHWVCQPQNHHRLSKRGRGLEKRGPLWSSCNTIWVRASPKLWVSNLKTSKTIYSPLKIQGIRIKLTPLTLMFLLKARRPKFLCSKTMVLQIEVYPIYSMGYLSRKLWSL